MDRNIEQKKVNVYNKYPISQKYHCVGSEGEKVAKYE